MPIEYATRERIKQYLQGAIRGALANFVQRAGHSTSRGELKPFHDAVAGSILSRVSGLERSLSTTLGSTFEQCALFIASDVHLKAVRQYSLSSDVNEQSFARCEEIVRGVRENGVSESLSQMVVSALSARSAGAPSRHVAVVSDIYIVTNARHEVFVEMKSPKPNKGQCVEAVQRMLHYMPSSRTNSPAGADVFRDAL